jgi:ADP-heptose:LPS heptosyltransferase
VKRIVGLPVNDDMQTNRWDDAAQSFEPEAVRLARNISELGDAELENASSWGLELTVKERARARSALGPLADGPLIAVSVGTKVQSKDWGRENWRALLARLAAEYGDYGLVLCGAPEESEASEFAADGWREAGGGRVVNLCGRLRPRESAAAMEHARLFVGHDSGPMHLAAAVQTPCVAIFAARNKPRVWFPYGARHRVIYHRTECWGCGLETCVVEKKRCLTSIRVDEVMEEIRKSLGAIEVAADGRRVKMR